MHRAERAEGWLKNLRLVHKFLEEQEESNPPVKIAILDTGVDDGHLVIQSQNQRIKGRVDWTTSSQEVQERKTLSDSAGHGTHAASILLRYAPSADIYIGKVSAAIKPDTDFVSNVAKVRHRF